MLAAPPAPSPAQPQQAQPQPPQRFFAAVGGGPAGLGLVEGEEEDAETRAARTLQAYCLEYKGMPDGAF